MAQHTLRMKTRSYYLINAITLYRLMAAPVLVLLLISRNTDIFRWLLVLSFFTDMIDGWLARKYKVTSILGARLDSIADDLTVAAGIAGLILLKPEFLKQQMVFIIPLLILFLVQISAALIRYGKFTSFHTYAAKLAAISQGVFLILAFFLPFPPLYFFYLAILITAIDLAEEIILVLLLPVWKSNIKGIYWFLNENSGR